MVKAVNNLKNEYMKKEGIMKQEKHSGIMPIYVNITLEDKGKDNKKEAIDFFSNIKRISGTPEATRIVETVLVYFKFFKRTKRCWN